MKTTKIRFGRRLNFIFSIFMVGVFTLSSCSSDDGGGGKSGNNYVILDGTKYSMKSAVYDNFPNDIIYNSVSISIENDSPRREISIHFYEKLFEELGSGTYTLKEYVYLNPGGTYNSNQHFGVSDFYYDYDTDFPFSSSKAELTSGTVTITKSGSNITIDLVGMTDKGAIEAHYEGTIKSRF